MANLLRPIAGAKIEAVMRDVQHELPLRGLAMDYFNGLWKALQPVPDALFCANDALATAALRAAADRGLSVPRHIAVLGFGDFDVAAHTSPALSTVRIPGRVIGERAAKALLARLEGSGAGDRRIDVGFEIVVRESA